MSPRAAVVALNLALIGLLGAQGRAAVRPPPPLAAEQPPTGFSPVRLALAEAARQPGGPDRLEVAWSGLDRPRPAPPPTRVEPVDEGSRPPRWSERHRLLVVTMDPARPGDASCLVASASGGAAVLRPGDALDGATVVEIALEPAGGARLVVLADQREELLLRR